MVVFFVLHGAGLARNFEPSIRLLAERGHLVHLGFPFKPKSMDPVGDWVSQYAYPVEGKPIPSQDADSAGMLARMAESFPNVSWGFLHGQRRDRWQKVLNGLRGCRDYLRHFDPAFRDAAALRDRFGEGVPAFFTFFTRLPLVRSTAGLRILSRFLAACELAIPVSQTAVDEILDVMPDVVLVSRLVDYDSIQVDYVRAAKYLGIPVGFAVASWDNLTNKGLIKVLPDFATVWNEGQKREAVDLHGMPEERVWTTGAQIFDCWFDRQPSVDRAGFCERFAFDSRRPLITYLCSSRQIADDEVGIVRRWLRAARNYQDPLVRDASVIVRPHPKHAEQWSGIDLHAFGPVEIWPRTGELPVTEEQRNDFFDTLYHSAVIVGLNTSAQIEAAIIGRPILVFIDPEAPSAREGTLETLHFRYLSDPAHGVAMVAHTTEEHLAQLSEALRRPMTERGRKFVEEFVRPHGLDRPAGAILADAIERGAASRNLPEPASSPSLLALRLFLLLLRPLGIVLFRKRRPRKRRGPGSKSAGLKTLQTSSGRVGAERL
jgi:hypothetical protein